MEWHGAAGLGGERPVQQLETQLTDHYLVARIAGQIGRFPRIGLEVVQFVAVGAPAECGVGFRCG